MGIINATIRTTRLVKLVSKAVPKPNSRFSIFCGYRRYLGTYSLAFQYYELKDVPKAVHKPNLHLYSCTAIHTTSTYYNT